MKICPSCRQTYTDDNLNFCLNDGSFLSNYRSAEPQTVTMEQPRVTNQTNWGSPPSAPPAPWQNPAAAQTPLGGYGLATAPKNQTLPTVSLVLGIFAVLLVCCWGGIPFGAGAVVTGAIAIQQEKNNPGRYGGSGLAVAGIVTGGLALLIGFGMLLLALVS